MIFICACHSFQVLSLFPPTLVYLSVSLPFHILLGFLLSSPMIRHKSSFFETRQRIIYHPPHLHEAPNQNCIFCNLPSYFFILCPVALIIMVSLMFKVIHLINSLSLLVVVLVSFFEIIFPFYNKTTILISVITFMLLCDSN